MSNRIQVAHRSVGQIDVASDAVVHFEYIPGFPGAHRFVVMEDRDSNAFVWLVCLDDLDLAFRTTDPLSLYSGYDPLGEIASAPDAESEREDLVVLAIVNLAAEPPTLNLAAPIVIDVKRRVGSQLILEDDRFAVRAAWPGLSDDPGRRGEGEGAQIESKPQR